MAHLRIMVNEIGDSQGLALSWLEGDNCTDIDSHADHAGIVAGCCRACRAESRATSNRIETDFGERCRPSIARGKQIPSTPSSPTAPDHSVLSKSRDAYLVRRLPQCMNASGDRERE